MLHAFDTRFLIELGCELTLVPTLFSDSVIENFSIVDFMESPLVSVVVGTDDVNGEHSERCAYNNYVYT